MIRVYLLPVKNINGTEKVTGSDLIHDALLLTTAYPAIRKLIMNTTTEDHDALLLLGALTAAISQEDLDLYNSTVIITPPDPDTIRAQEILSTSPPLITMPEMWELMHIYGRRLGYTT